MKSGCISIRWVTVWSILALVLAACGSAVTPTPALPLAQGQPTFIFFYTDN